jgi:hypothetical protein
VSASNFRTAVLGGRVGFVTGITWLPDEVLDELAAGTESTGPAESLAGLASTLGLDFAVVPAGEWWAVEAVRELHQRDIGVMWSVAGMLGRVGERVGWGEMLRMTAAEPGALAVHIGEVLHDALDAARLGIAEGADALLVADDVAGATGPLVAPDYTLDALVPCYRSLAREAIDHEVPAVFHSDGDIRSMFRALKRAGFAAVHLAGLSPGPLATSHIAARSADLVVLGGLESAALGSGARRLGAHAASLALSGGMLVCDDGGMTSAEEVAAYASALESARETYARGGTPVGDA